MQVRDDVTGADELVTQCGAAIDDVTGHVTVTSRRLNDVTQRADRVSMSVQAQFADSTLDAIAAVSLWLA